jgi:hypothetical protein
MERGCQVPTGSIGEESQSDADIPIPTYYPMRFMGPNERESRDRESKTDLQDCLPRKRPLDHLRFLPPPGGRARGVRAAELRSPSSCRWNRWSTWLGRQFTRAPLGIGARSRVFERLVGRPQWQAFRVFWTTCCSCFPGNGTVIFFSAVRLGNDVGIDQCASSPSQRVRSMALLNCEVQKWKI